MQLRDRTILVIDDAPDTVAALLDRVRPERAILRRCRHGGEDDAITGIVPHPFAVVGVGDRTGGPPLGCRTVALLAGRPVPVAWFGAAPPGLPAASACTERFSELRDIVVGWVTGDALDLCLDDRRGVVHAGRRISSVALEGVVAAHPRPVACEAGTRSGLRRLLRRHGLRLALVSRGPGLVGLESAG